MTNTHAPISAKQDLVSAMADFLPKHLLLPLLLHTRETEVFSSEDVDRAIAKTLESTNLVDSLIEVKTRLKAPAAELKALEERRQKVLDENQRLEAKSKLLHLIEVNGGPDQMTTAKLTEILNAGGENGKEPTDEDYEDLFAVLMHQYSCGKYDSVPQLLGNQAVTSNMTEARKMEAAWGVLTCEILMGDVDKALNLTLKDLKKRIAQKDVEDEKKDDEDKMEGDEKTEKPTARCTETDRIYERAVLLHMSLFLIFGKGDFDPMVGHGIWTDPSFSNTIQTMCPHLLRYYVVGLFLSMATKDLRDAAELVNDNAFSYKDSITEFLRLLVLENDFEGTRDALKECQEVMANDFFLAYYLDVFNEAARQVILRKFCKLYNRIQVSELKRFLLFEKDDECLSFIARCHPSGDTSMAGGGTSDDRQDMARIDMANGAVYIQCQTETPYQQLLAKYKALDVQNRTVDLFAKANQVRGRQ